MEKIISIKEVHNVPGINAWSSKCDGYEVTTDKQTIMLLIENGQSCCESWGYFMSDDFLTEYIGADLHSIKVTDEALKTKVYDTDEIKHSVNEWGKGTRIMFVNMETSNGVLQFVAHNSHNGYYGHTAYVISDQLTKEEDL